MSKIFSEILLLRTNCLKNYGLNKNNNNNNNDNDNYDDDDDDDDDYDNDNGKNTHTWRVFKERKRESINSAAINIKMK